MASTYLQRTQGSATNRKKFTISVWFKISNSSSSANLISAGTSYANDMDYLTIGSGGGLSFEAYQGGTSYRLRPNRLFRDTNAWYHLVIAFDSTQATSSDRMKMYLNGEQITSFSTTTYPSLNFEPQFNNNVTHMIGRNLDGSEYFDGSMSHFHFIDGTAYDATAFGEYDANGVWKIKTSPSVTYGNNGFFILKDGNSVTDQSGNGNNFTVGGGTLTNTEDSPSNVFCTWNALDKHASSTLSNGNTKYATSGTSQYEPAKCTLGFSSGKYYSEHQINSLSTTGCFIGIYGTSVSGQSQSEMDTSRFCYNVQNGEIIKNASNLQTGLATFTTNDILGIEVDCDAGTLKFYKNGTQVGTTITDSDISSTEWTFGTQPRLATFSSNFGNGYFGTTAVASAGTNASGIGIFEYDVPTGYTALSTKGLNL
jgi:hypothetical protein